jgi:heme exporter protein A
VLSHIDLQVKPGEVWAIAGANGAGKTTLLRVMASLLPPSRGRVRLNALDPDADIDAYRSSVAFLSHCTGLYEDLSARENIASVARLLGKPLSLEEIDVLCAEMSLAANSDLPVRRFSAGMRKRLALARLTLQQPRVVLLDEPYGQLDDAGFALIDRLVAKWREQGTAVVMASHLLARAGAVADHGVILSEGQIRWTGEGAALVGAWAALQAESTP